MRSNQNPGKRGIKESFDSEDFLLEFDTVSEDFMRGFECGEIWACLSDGVDYLSSIISADNALMVMRMVDAANKTYDFDYMFEGFELPIAAVGALELGPGEWMSVSIKRASYNGQSG